MKKPFQILDELNRTDENEHIEAKDCRAGQIGKSVYNTLSAFSNGPSPEGGDLLFGVERHAGKYRAVGVRDPDKLQSDLAAKCSEFNVGLRPHIQIEERDGKCLISAFIPEADKSAKPVYRRSVGLPQGAYQRIGASDIQCTDDDLVKLYSQRSEQSYDSKAVLRASLSEDIDPHAIEYFLKALKSTKPNSELLGLSQEQLLKALNCSVEHEGKQVPTVAGLLLFGTRLALRREFSMAARVDYIRVIGNSWVEDSYDRGEVLEVREALVTGVRRIIATILDDIPRANLIVPGQLERLEVPRVPESVVREAVVNAVMHRNYQSHRPTQMIRFSNRIEFANAGYSLKPADKLGETGSRPRNPEIASVLHQMQLAESRGTGIHAMRRDMKKPAWPRRSLPRIEKTTYSKQHSGSSIFCRALISNGSPNSIRDGSSMMMRNTRSFMFMNMEVSPTQFCEISPATTR